MTDERKTTEMVDCYWSQGCNMEALAALAARRDSRPRVDEFKDPITGLMPRVVLLEKGAALMAAARDGRAPLSAVIVDVDCLKAINEQHSPEAGDMVLAHVAKLIRLNIQTPSDLAARNLGAEFVLLLPEADASWASAFAERLRGTLANRPVAHAEALITVSASFGVAALEAEDETLDDLIARARRAMRTAKLGGRNRTQVAGLRLVHAA